MFYFIAMLVTPSFKDYLDYFYDFDFPFDALNEIILSTCVFSAGLIYAVFSKRVWSQVISNYRSSVLYCQ